MRGRKKILLFGGTGFVGSAIAHGFRKSYTMISPQHRELDVSSFYSLKKYIAHAKADLIIYAAGVTSVDKCEEDPELAKLLNTKAPEAIAAYAATLNIPLFYISTDAVFPGNKKDVHYNEEDKVGPFSTYGKTKLAGEEVVLKHSSRNAVIRIICPFSLFYEKKIDFARLAIKKLTHNENFPGIVDQTMNPLYMSYLVHALQKLTEKKASGIYHLGATDYDTNYNIVKRLAGILGLDETLLIPITFKKFMANKKSLRSQYSFLDVSKFQKKFGKGILHDLEVSLKEFAKNKF